MTMTRIGFSCSPASASSWRGVGSTAGPAVRGTTEGSAARLATDRSPAPVREAAADPDEHLVSLLSPRSFEAEQYRMLRHILESRHRSTGLKVLAIASPGTGDGKTTTTINLGGALAQTADSRVLLIDGDLRRPAVSAQLGLVADAPTGLADVIADPRLAFEDAVRRLPKYNLFVLPAGRCPDSPYEILKSPQFARLLENARSDYDYVLVDCPPLLALPDCRVIERSVDALLLVVSAHRTPRELLEESLTVVDPAKTLGLIFNNDTRPLHGYYGRYGRYYSSRGGRSAA